MRLAHATFTALPHAEAQDSIALEFSEFKAIIIVAVDSGIFFYNGSIVLLRCIFNPFFMLFLFHNYSRFA